MAAMGDPVSLLTNMLSLRQTQAEPQQPTATPAWDDAMEQGFQQWYAQLAQQLHLNPDPDDPRHQYDYRAAYLAGAMPDPQTGHWPSLFKAPGHPNRFVMEGGSLIDSITGQPVR